MYLTDYREYCLKDVIRQLEPELFRKVTGLTLKDFELLVSLNVFNSELMNDAVYKFKRYEDSSLEYTGINTHTGNLVGGWDTVVDTSLLTKESKPEPKAIENTVSVSDLQQALVQEVEPWERIQVGDIVIHKSIGMGQVMTMDEKYIIVKFPDREAKFLFPSAFEKGHLSVK